MFRDNLAAMAAVRDSQTEEELRAKIGVVGVTAEQMAFLEIQILKKKSA
jgi:hypothetical protein